MSKFVGTGLLSYKKRIYRAAVSQRLRNTALVQCFSTAGPRPGTGPWHKLYRAATGLSKLQYATRFHWSS